jgi:regulator of sigma E protease
VTLKLNRGGVEATRRLTPVKLPSETFFEIGDIGVLPDTHPRLVSVSAGEPGERDGLKADDIILTINGKPITFQLQLREAIAAHPERPMTMTVLRGGREHTLTVTPKRNGEVGYLGVVPEDEMKSIKLGLLQAVNMSVRENVKTAGLIFQTIGGLLTRETSPKQLMGPVAIAQLSGEAAQLGLFDLLGLMASISLNLGLLNLLPIPVLDGGHILIMALEGVTRRDFSVRAKERMLMTGLVVLMMLMVTVIYNDLTRISWIERLMPWR